MPYTMDNAPDEVKRLPERARKMWISVFNNVMERESDEKKAFAAAWSAVKKEFRQNEDGEWFPVAKDLGAGDAAGGGDRGDTGKGLVIPDNPDPATVRNLIERFNELAEGDRAGKSWRDWATTGCELAQLAGEVLGGSWVYRRGRVVEDYNVKGDATMWGVGGPVKALSVDGDTVRVGAYAVLWGGPDTRDLTGEYFTPETEELDVIYKGIGKLPFIYRHAADGTVKATVIGEVDFMQADDVGLWYEAQIKVSDKYRRAIVKMIEEGKLGTSTGTLPRARRVAKDGRITRWPIIEVSATPAPADWRHGVEYPVNVVKEHYRELGLDVPELVASVGEEGEEPTGERTASGPGKESLKARPDVERLRVEVARMWTEATKAVLEATITEE